MKKKSILFITLLLSLFSGISANEQDDQIIYAMLMNQIQFSLQTIEYYESRLILDKEYENILCKIDKTKLKDTEGEAIAAYGNLLNVLTTLKLKDNEKIFIKEQAEKERSDAVYKSLTNVGTATAVAVAALARQDAISAVVSLVYAGISTVFSYNDAMNSVNNQENKDIFRLEDATLKTLDMQRNKLWETYSKFINKYNIPKEYEIKEDQMEWFVKTLGEKAKAEDAEEKIRLLEAKRDLFYIFSPYWFELGSAYQLNHNYKKAKECYAEFEKQKARYSIIDNDTYYTELAKNMILMAQKENDIATIKKYLAIIEKDRTVNTESENRFYMAGVLFTIGDPIKASNFLKLIIDDNQKNITSARLLYQYIEAETAKDINHKKVFALSKLKIATLEETERTVAALKKKIKIEKKANPDDPILEKLRNIQDNQLVFLLPAQHGQKYDLSIQFNNTLYKSISLDYNGMQYYFIDYRAKEFFKKTTTFSVILAGENDDKIELDYNMTYYDSDCIKTLKKIYSVMHNSEKKKKESIDFAYINHINVRQLIAKFQEQEKNKDYKKKLPKEKLKTVLGLYETAVKSRLEIPYDYQRNIEFQDNNYFYIYSLISFISISDKQKYEFSKYGGLQKPVAIVEPIAEQQNDNQFLFSWRILSDYLKTVIENFEF